MIRWIRSVRPVRPAESGLDAEAGGQERPPRRWRRHLTVDNAFFFAVVLILGFVLARRQGIFLAGPSVEVPARGERGTVAPEFVLPDLSGTPVRLTDHRGNVVLLNFWATWCPPCRAEMPSMERLYQAYRNRGFVILAISGDRAGRSVVESFVQERGVTFPILLDPAGEVFAQYGVRGLPTSYLLNRRGRIVSADVGARDWSGRAAREIAERLLAEK